MLLRYIVSNFKSIGHPLEFNMLPTKESDDQRFLKSIKVQSSEWKVLQRSGFFGPNASGKSSFIESIAFARDYIVVGQKSEHSTGVDQFRGDFEDLNGLSSFQFTLYYDGDVFEYGFSMNTKQVCEEWLMQVTEKGSEPVFTRLTNESGETQIEIESLLSTESTEKALAEVLISSMGVKQKSLLFLYRLYDHGIKLADRVMQWFKNLQIIFPHTKVQALPILINSNENLRNYIAKMLERLDTGVYSITVASDEIDFRDIAKELSLPDDLIEKIKTIRDGIVNLNGKYFIFQESAKRTTFIQLKFSHRLNNKECQFNLEEESYGTQRLIDLLPMLFALNKSSCVYFIDEIDRSLHTKLSRFLLQEFAQKAKEGTNQIIFTAHDVNLIDLKYFRQEEIWFIDKNHLGESNFRPLSDFKIEDGQDPFKSYMSGRFGSIPMIKGS